MAFVVAAGHTDIEHGFGIAATLFVIAAATDFFDGYLARRWGITTIVGAFLDTTADKLLVTGALISLISVGRASVWVTFIIMAREFVVMALRGITALGGARVEPSLWGKAKAAVQFVAAFLAMMRLPEEWGPWFLDEWVMWAAALITLISGWEYIRRFREVVKTVDADS